MTSRPTSRESCPLAHLQARACPRRRDREYTHPGRRQVSARVITVEGSPMHFKPRMYACETEVERELHILMRMDKVGLTARLRIARLQRLVVSGVVTIGMLKTLMTSLSIGTHLRRPGLQDRHELHKQWEEQLTTMVRGLHVHDSVWGDVGAMNVVVDEEMEPNSWTMSSARRLRATGRASRGCFRKGFQTQRDGASRDEGLWSVDVSCATCIWPVLSTRMCTWVRAVTLSNAMGD